MLLTHEVEIPIYSQNVNHYKNKGYNIPMKYSDKMGYEIIDRGVPILVKVEDLPKTSHVQIQYQCDVCGEIFTTSWCDWNRRKYRELGDMCKDCAAKTKLPVAMKDKYGYDNPAKVDSIIEKKKQTNKRKYGNEWSIASDSVRETIHSVFLEKYGVDNPMQTKEVKEKAKKTNNERYGGNSALCDEAVRAKSIKTCLQKYGVPNAYQAKENQLKARRTLYKNGTTPTSKAEKAMCQLLVEIFGQDNCFPNYPVSSLSLDCLVLTDGIKIDFEYDGYYWHKNRGQKDAARNAVLMNMGYKIVRIKANNQDTLPTKEQIEEAVDYLVKGNHRLKFIDMNN